MSRRASREAALVELQRLHAAILASRERRGVGVSAASAVGPTTPPSPEALAAQELTRRLQAGPSAAEDAAADGPRSRRGWWVAVAAAVVVAGAWLAVTQSQRPEVITEAAPPKAATPDAGREAATAPRSAPAAAAAASAAAPASARPVQVTLTTTRPVWLRVTVDGTRALQREAAAGETLSFGGDRAVVIRAGDAGAVQATLNGADRGALGLRGWPLTVAMTPTGIEPLTPTRPEP